MLFQPSNISPDEINGTGCIDAAKDLDISWQVNGDSAMTAYKIDIYLNDTQSTLRYSTNKIALATPFWGVDYQGSTQFYSARINAASLSAAGIVNGEEYKLLITQWWGSKNIQQTTASVFITRETPTVTIENIPSPLTSKAYSFTGQYAQAQGDGLKWVRWQIAERGKESEPFLDTGNITGTGELKVDYDGFFTASRYSIKLSVETANGIPSDTGWVEFLVSYAVTEPEGNVQACQIDSDSAVYVRWDRMDIAQGYSVLRQTVGENVLHKVADVDGTTGQLRDYGVQSGHQYIYYVFPIGELAYLTKPMVSETVDVQFYFWAIIEAKRETGGRYAAIESHLFRMGTGGVNEGQFSNNNTPQILKNFTPYPTRQGDSANYLTGSVSGLIGSISSEDGKYSDSVESSRKLMELSVSRNTLFLLDPKGHFLKIHTDGPISLSINHKNTVMPQTMSVKWVEVGTTNGISLYSAPGGDFFPSDAVAATEFEVDAPTGSLLWKTPNGYRNGSRMSLNANGELIQTADGAFTPADMSLDKTTMEVSASIS